MGFRARPSYIMVGGFAAFEDIDDVNEEGLFCQYCTFLYDSPCNGYGRSADGKTQRHKERRELKKKQRAANKPVKP